MKSRLKAKHAMAILEHKKRFQEKVVAGKLPPLATEELLTWWFDNLPWPYPTEDDKDRFAETTGLNPTQINNW